MCKHLEKRDASGCGSIVLALRLMLIMYLRMSEMGTYSFSKTTSIILGKTKGLHNGPRKELPGIYLFYLLIP